LSPPYILFSLSSLYTNITPAAPAIAPARPIFLNPLTGTAAPVASTAAVPLLVALCVLSALLVPVTLCVLAFVSKLALLDATTLCIPLITVTSDVTTLEGIGDDVSTARLGAAASDVGSELDGVITALLSTLKASPHVGVGEAEGSRLSVEVVAAGSTVNGSPQDDVCAEETPRRERRVVFRREDLRILDGAVEYVCFVGLRFRSAYLLR
jgi:hypothetical protein